MHAQVALKEFEAKKSSEISRVCHRHYSEFIDSVEDLMKMKTEMVGLKDQVCFSASSCAQGTVGVRACLTRCRLPPPLGERKDEAYSCFAYLTC